MDSSPIRVVLPAGDAFVPAFVDAAATFAARRRYGSDVTSAIVQLVELGCLCINSSQPSSVSLTVTEATSQTTVALAGVQPTTTLAKDPGSDFTKTAVSVGASASVDHSATSVSFTFNP